VFKYVAMYAVAPEVINSVFIHYIGDPHENGHISLVQVDWALLLSVL
jgi:hypothetical protein